MPFWLHKKNWRYSIATNIKSFWSPFNSFKNTNAVLTKTTLDDCKVESAEDVITLQTYIWLFSFYLQYILAPYIPEFDFGWILQSPSTTLSPQLFNGDLWLSTPKKERDLLTSLLMCWSTVHLFWHLISPSGFHSYSLLEFYHQL